MFGSPTKNNLFGWVVAQPRARVEGTITVDGKVNEVTGHRLPRPQLGLGVPAAVRVALDMGQALSTDRFTMIFADITTTKKCGGYAVPLVFLALDDKIVLESARADCEASRLRERLARASRYIPSKVDFKFAERDVAGELHFEVSKELEMRQHRWARSSPPRWWMPSARLSRRPAYYRFLSDYKGWIEVGDERLELAGETHWEYMVMNLRRGKVPKPASKINI